MTARWPVRLGGPVIGLVLAACASATAVDSAALVVRDADGMTLARVALPGDGSFALRYRNSLYGSLVEERFLVEGAAIVLDELAADQLAVLEEYYGTDGPASEAGAGDPRAWVGRPLLRVRDEQLTLAATDLGERTLLVRGAEPISLWRLATDSEPMLTLEVDR